MIVDNGLTTVATSTFRKPTNTGLQYIRNGAALYHAVKNNIT